MEVPGPGEYRQAEEQADKNRFNKNPQAVIHPITTLTDPLPPKVPVPGPGTYKVKSEIGQQSYHFWMGDPQA